MGKRLLLEEIKTKAIIERLAYQLLENHFDFNESVIIGLQPRGTKLAERIAEILEKKHHIKELKLGYLDITFFRDDFRHRDISDISKAYETNINFLVENKKTILIDDVLYTGRSIRAALSALQGFGRPKNLELMVLIDRRFSREFPISPDYTGIKIDVLNNERVSLDWSTENPKVYILKN